MQTVFFFPCNIKALAFNTVANERVSNPTCAVILTFHGCGKCSKISNIFLFLFSNKMLVFMARIHKMLVRIDKQCRP